MKYKNSFVFLVLFVFLSFPAFSKTDVALSPLEWAKSFEEYLYSLGEISGKFTQVDQLGKVSKGTFWSNGKGSIKFSYAPKLALLIIINNGLISVKEGGTDAISHYSIKDSPMANLFSESFNLEKFIINKIFIDGSIGTIELRTKKNTVRNSLFLTGTYPSPGLKQWKLIDSQNNETLVFFSKIEKFNFLDEKFFNIE